MKHRVLWGIVLAVLLALSACARNMATGPINDGVAAANEEDWEKAVEHWTKALELSPDSAAVHNNLAVAYERQGSWEQAAKEYETALRLDPDNAQIRGNYESFKGRLEAGRKRKG